MDLNPAQYRLFLAGPRVARLLPFFGAKGYVAAAAVNGEDVLEALRKQPHHLLLVEVELEDILLADLVQVVRRENLVGAVILLEDPAKSGLIVSQLVRGVDAYVATPPDEQYMFRIIERHLLAQWAAAQSGPSGGGLGREEKQRLEKQVKDERAKVTELVKEIASLREQITSMRRERASDFEDLPDTAHAPMQRMQPVDKAAQTFDDDDDVSSAVTQKRKSYAPSAAPATTPAQPRAGATIADDRTSPSGHKAPIELRPPPAIADPSVEDELDGDLVSALSGELDDDDEPIGEAKPDLDEGSSDIFLDLEDPTAAHPGSDDDDPPTINTQAQTDPKRKAAPR